jgi:hypothetical protein
MSWMREYVEGVRYMLLAIAVGSTVLAIIGGAIVLVVLLVDLVIR